MADKDLELFSCYCVERSPDEVRRMMLAGRWRELEQEGVGHICTGCRADYRILKARLRKGPPATPVSEEQELKA